MCFDQRWAACRVSGAGYPLRFSQSDLLLVLRRIAWRSPEVLTNPTRLGEEDHLDP